MRVFCGEPELEMLYVLCQRQVMGAGWGGVRVTAENLPEFLSSVWRSTTIFFGGSS